MDILQVIGVLVFGIVAVGGGVSGAWVILVSLFSPEVETKQERAMWLAIGLGVLLIALIATAIVINIVVKATV